MTCNSSHTLCRTFLEEREPENTFFADTRLHLHVPEGATPKVKKSSWGKMVQKFNHDSLRTAQALVSRL